eukprot:2439253-Amphidinium_carterae.1
MHCVHSKSEILPQTQCLDKDTIKQANNRAPKKTRNGQTQNNKLPTRISTKKAFSTKSASPVGRKEAFLLFDCSSWPLAP